MCHLIAFALYIQVKITFKNVSGMIVFALLFFAILNTNNKCKISWTCWSQSLTLIMLPLHHELTCSSTGSDDIFSKSSGKGTPAGSIFAILKLILLGSGGAFILQHLNNTNKIKFHNYKFHVFIMIQHCFTVYQVRINMWNPSLVPLCWCNGYRACHVCCRLWVQVTVRSNQRL